MDAPWAPANTPSARRISTRCSCVPLMALLVPLWAGAGGALEKDSTAAGVPNWLFPTVVAVLCGLTLPLFNADYNLWVALAVALSAWLVLGCRATCGTGYAVRYRWPPACAGSPQLLGHVPGPSGIRRLRHRYRGDQPVQHRARPQNEPRRYRNLAGYEFRFVELVPVRGPNFLADEARVEVYRNGEFVARLAPQKALYGYRPGDDRGGYRSRPVPRPVRGDGRARWRGRRLGDTPALQTHGAMDVAGSHSHGPGRFHHGIRQALPAPAQPGGCVGERGRPWGLGSNCSCR